MDEMLLQRYRVPAHVVHRPFAEETVVLNLRTGQYHGLNPVAGRMLEVIEETGDPQQAVQRVAAEWQMEPSRVRADAEQLCADLLDRQLIEPAGDG